MNFNVEKELADIEVQLAFAEKKIKEFREKGWHTEGVEIERLRAVLVLRKQRLLDIKWRNVDCQN